MWIPTIHGYIDRRILINYVADPAVVSHLLPKPFIPKLYKGKAVVGICLIRLKSVKPKGFPDFLGVGSENAAHRFAVEWEDEKGEMNEGVYIPRRDTSLYLNSLVGGRIFPGKHYLAKFNVQELKEYYRLESFSSDHNQIQVSARSIPTLSSGSIFDSLDTVSQFFEKGSVGYSPNKKTLEGLKLETYRWEVSPLEVMHLKSTYFENRNNFPEGSIQFDHAILMKNIEHEWKTLKSISCV